MTSLFLRWKKIRFSFENFEIFVQKHQRGEAFFSRLKKEEIFLWMKKRGNPFTNHHVWKRGNLFTKSKKEEIFLIKFSSLVLHVLYFIKMRLNALVLHVLWVSPAALPALPDLVGMNDDEWMMNEWWMNEKKRFSDFYEIFYKWSSKGLINAIFRKLWRHFF